MEKYRIKIETLADDKIWYAPEVLIREGYLWRALTESGDLKPVGYSVVSYDEIEKAESIIDKRKNNILKHQQSTAGTIEYKYL
jgi:hypothetical protein